MQTTLEIKLRLTEQEKSIRNNIICNVIEKGQLAEMVKIKLMCNNTRKTCLTAKDHRETLADSELVVNCCT